MFRWYLSCSTSAPTPQAYCMRIIVLSERPAMLVSLDLSKVIDCLDKSGGVMRALTRPPHRCLFADGDSLRLLIIAHRIGSTERSELILERCRCALQFRMSREKLAPFDLYMVSRSVPIISNGSCEGTGGSQKNSEEEEGKPRATCRVFSPFSGFDQFLTRLCDLTRDRRDLYGRLIDRGLFLRK